MEDVDLGVCRAQLFPGSGDRAAFLLPGARYVPAAPLLWFAREVLQANDCTVLQVWDEWDRSEDPMGWVSDRVDAGLNYLDHRSPMLVAKSLTTLAIPIAVERALPGVWLTPLMNQDDRGHRSGGDLRARAREGHTHRGVPRDQLRLTATERRGHEDSVNSRICRFRPLLRVHGVASSATPCTRMMSPCSQPLVSGIFIGVRNLHSWRAPRGETCWPCDSATKWRIDCGGDQRVELVTKLEQWIFWSVFLIVSVVFGVLFLVDPPDSPLGIVQVVAPLALVVVWKVAGDASRKHPVDGKIEALTVDELGAVREWARRDVFTFVGMFLIGLLALLAWSWLGAPNRTTAWVIGQAAVLTVFVLVHMSARCPKCGHRLGYDTVIGRGAWCRRCGVALTPKAQRLGILPRHLR